MMTRKFLIVLLLIINSALALFLFIVYEKNGEVPAQSDVDQQPELKLTKNLEANISAVIVPHHDLVAKKRADLLKGVSENTSPNTIILVSTNHFDTGKDKIITSDKEWSNNQVRITPNNTVIDQIVTAGLTSVDQNAFSTEHGIVNILPDIFSYFPNTKLVPLIIKSSATAEDVEELGTGLLEACDKNCLLVASIDFSHYQPSSLAELHDDLSLRALVNLDQDLAWQAEVDSNQALRLTIQWAKARGTEKFRLSENTNSGLLSGNFEAESTSYIFGWYERGERDQKDGVSFMIGGDMMFDRAVDSHFRGNKIYDIFENFGDRVFQGVDLSLINLEGPISSGTIPIDTTANNMIFNFPPLTSNVLEWLHVKAASLANNHTNNNGKAGLENTRQVLIDKGITPIGQEVGLSNTSIKRYDYDTEKVSVIAVNILETNQDLSSTIKQEKADGYFTIIFPHWGSEYETSHSSSQERLAHSWIDAGADLVVGSHPHVIQDAEIYKNKPVFYSLGNLLFDQTFSQETQRGLIIGGKVSSGRIKEIILLPTLSRSLKPELLRGKEREEFIIRFRQMLGQDSCSSSDDCGKIIFKE